MDRTDGKKIRDWGPYIGKRCIVIVFSERKYSHGYHLASDG